MHVSNHYKFFDKLNKVYFKVKMPTVEYYKKLCKDRGIKGCNKLRKQELENLLNVQVIKSPSPKPFVTKNILLTRMIQSFRPKLLQQQCDTFDLVFKNGKLQQNDKGQVIFKNKFIKWHDLKEDFKDGIIDYNTMKAIGCLRRMTVSFFVETHLRLGSSCYVEIGSKDVTSDLDFTYVSYAAPDTVVPRMLTFYNDFKKIFGNYPDVTFDTNFYISSTIINQKCFNLIKDPFVSRLFQMLTVSNRQKMYCLNNFKNKEQFKLVDFYNCFVVQSMYLNLLGKQINKLDMLLKSATLFYLAIQQKGDVNLDERLLHIRTLYYFMAMYSNESYISDESLKIILYNIQPNNDTAKYLIYVDQYIFIYEWYLTYKTKQDDTIGYFDVISKYIDRAGKVVDFDRKLKQYAKMWKDEIRNKISFTEAKANPKYTLLFKYLETEWKTVDALFKPFLDLFNKVKTFMESPKVKNITLSASQNYVSKIKDELKHVNVFLKDETIFVELSLLDPSISYFL